MVNTPRGRGNEGSQAARLHMPGLRQTFAILLAKLACQLRHCVLRCADVKWFTGTSTRSSRYHPHALKLARKSPLDPIARSHVDCGLADYEDNFSLSVTPRRKTSPDPQSRG